MDIMEKRIDYLDDIMQKIAYEHLNTEIELRNFSKEAELSRKRSEHEMKEFREEMRASREELNKKWGELANKMGTIVEDIVAPNIPTIAAAYFGLKTLSVFATRYRKEHPQEPGRIREFDIIAVGGEYLFLNETKSTPRQEYLKAFADNHREVFEYLPEYKDKILVPIFSSLSLSREAIDFLTKHRIYAMAMKGDTMDLLNFEEVNNRQTTQ